MELADRPGSTEAVKTKMLDRINSGERDSTGD
jgi:hypothetical protein